MTALRDKYEYRAETISKILLAPNGYGNEQLMADLNKRGEDGWELITFSAVPQGNQLHINFIWKRKIVETLQ